MALPGPLAESARSFRRVFANRNLRLLSLAFTGSSVGDWAYIIGLYVYAYEQAGAAAVGVSGVVRLVPSAIVAPLAGALGDRYDRRRILIASDASRAALIGLGGVVAYLGASLALLLLIAALVSVASTVFRPAEAAMTPTLARTPDELTAANAVGGVIYGATSFIGPAVGGVILAAGGVTTLFVATAVLYAWSMVMMLQLRPPQREKRADASGRTRFRDELLVGARVVTRRGPVRLLTAISSAYFLIVGAVDVLVVVVALELLHTGRPGVGYLNSALGVGAIAGGLIATSRVGKGRLAFDVGASMVALGAALALVGASSDQYLAAALLAAVGGGMLVGETALATLTQRAVDEAILARVFGIQEMLVLAALALGSGLTPAVVSLFGARGALVAVGLLLPAVTIINWRALVALDRRAVVPARARELLQAISLFAPLSPPTIEQLAGDLVPIAVPAGETVIREGDVGDRFYIVDSGELAVDVSGVEAPALREGSFFGEIALLHDRPRTATVTAVTDANLFALERDAFLAAIAGHPQSAEAARSIVSSRLGAVRTVGT